MCSSISNLGFVAQLLDFNWLDFCSSNGIFVPFLFKNLQFDVTFPALPCSILSLDAMDISGEQHLDVVCILNCDFLFLHVREPFSAQWVLDFFFPYIWSAVMWFCYISLYASVGPRNLSERLTLQFFYWIVDVLCWWWNINRPLFPLLLSFLLTAAEIEVL